jgi:hypothetical protein
MDLKKNLSGDQEDCGSKLVQSNCLRDPILKVPNTKKCYISSSSGRTLPSKHEALSSRPNSAKKDNKKENTMMDYT